MAGKLVIRRIKPEEYQPLGQIMVEVYSDLEGFPGPEVHPDYYQTLADIGQLNETPHTQVLVALNDKQQLIGGVVYFSDMSAYGAGGSITEIKNASGIRLLGVSSQARGLGAGKALTQACIQLAKAKGQREVILHTTQAMQLAWSMYLKAGFKRSEELDFLYKGFPVFGFRLDLA